MWQTNILHWKSFLLPLLLFTRFNIKAAKFESASIWPTGLTTNKQAESRTSWAGSVGLGFTRATPCVATRWTELRGAGRLTHPHVIWESSPTMLFREADRGWREPAHVLQISISLLWAMEQSDKNTSNKFNMQSKQCSLKDVKIHAVTVVCFQEAKTRQEKIYWAWTAACLTSFTGWWWEGLAILPLHRSQVQPWDTRKHPQGRDVRKESLHPRKENHQRHSLVCGFTDQANCDWPTAGWKKGLN